MRIMKVVLLGIAFSLLLTMAVFSANADQAICCKTPPQFSPLYNHTYKISADLSFDGNTAICHGAVYPSEVINVSVTVSLYKQNGSSWTFLKSWTGNATGGATAFASGTKIVSSGTYKVVTSGNVGGLEFPTASVTKTKP